MRSWNASSAELQPLKGGGNSVWTHQGQNLEPVQMILSLSEPAHAPHGCAEESQIVPTSGPQGMTLELQIGPQATMFGCPSLIES